MLFQHQEQQLLNFTTYLHLKSTPLPLKSEATLVFPLSPMRLSLLPMRSLLVSLLLLLLRLLRFQLLVHDVCGFGIFRHRSVEFLTFGSETFFNGTG